MKEKYDEYISFHEVPGRSPLIHFTNLSGMFINELFNRKRTTDLEDSNHILKAASKLILDDLRAKAYNKDIYPASTAIESLEENLESLPHSLASFLSFLISEKLKIASIGQALVQSVKPRTYVLPILLGLSASLDNTFGSRWLIDVLHKFGFCLGYGEVIRHKQSVVRQQNLVSFVKSPFHSVGWR